MSTAESALVNSRWWYWVAAVPVYFVLAVVFAFVLLAAFFVGVTAIPRVGGFALFGLGALSVLFYAVPALVFTFLYPIALYQDAAAVRRADLGWRPNGTAYLLIGLVGTIFTGFVVSVPLSAYYLLRRRRHVGVP